MIAPIGARLLVVQREHNRAPIGLVVGCSLAQERALALVSAQAPGGIRDRRSF
jgi:hypothetical protein